MFWILRRTGAANFFNSLNNNCGTSKGSNNNNKSTQDKYVKRPPRKAYGRLSADSDDAESIKHKIDDPFDDIDNFAMVAPGNGNEGELNGSVTTNGNDPLMTNACPHAAASDGGGGNECNLVRCNSPSCVGKYVEGDFTQLGANQKEINAKIIQRIRMMAMSDDEDYDESLTCNVCDRAFHCHRQLASHQQKKRHFGCSGCDSLFPSLMLLEHHKEEFEHWSDDEYSRRPCCRRNRGDDYFTDTDSFTSEAESEDLERLL